MSVFFFLISLFEYREKSSFWLPRHFPSMTLFIPSIFCRLSVCAFAICISWYWESTDHSKEPGWVYCYVITLLILRRIRYRCFKKDSVLWNRVAFFLRLWMLFLSTGWHLIPIPRMLLCVLRLFDVSLPYKAMAMWICAHLPQVWSNSFKPGKITRKSHSSEKFVRWALMNMRLAEWEPTTQ